MQFPCTQIIAYPAEIFSQIRMLKSRAGCDAVVSSRGAKTIPKNANKRHKIQVAVDRSVQYLLGANAVL